MENYMLDDGKLDKLLTKFKKKKIKTSHIFAIDSIIKKDCELKMCLLHYQHKTNRCDKCKQVGFWNKKPLDLLVYRKNKKPSDNRLENLMLLCPNCYSQTSPQNLWIKLNKSKMLVCIDCGKKFKNKKPKKIIDPCANIGKEDSSYHSLVIAKSKPDRKRCFRCLEMQILKKDYTKLDSISKSNNQINSDKIVVI
jgi:hypothetical protein